MGEYEHGLLDCDCLLIEPMDMTSRSVCTEGSLSLCTAALFPQLPPALDCRCVVWTCKAQMLIG